VIAAVGALVAWKLDWATLDRVVHPASWAFLFVAVGANFISVAMKGFAWKGIVDGLPGLERRSRFRDLISPLFVGFLFNTVLAARLGEVVKVLLVRRRLKSDGHDIRATTLLGTVLAENLVATIAWVALVVSIGIFLPLPTYAWLASIGLGVVCLGIIVAALSRRASGGSLPSWVTRSRLGARIGRAIARLWEAVRESHQALRNPRQMAIVGSACIATWLAQWAGIYATLNAFGLERVGWGGAGLLLVTVTLAQAFPVLPGNLVVFQAAAVLPLTQSYGVGAGQALGFSVVLQFTEAIVGVAIGFLFLMSEGMSFGQLRREAEAEGIGDAAK
jgi:Lysylphosphatidylglycerol synthase TM region